MNLIYDKWIPVRRADGTPEKIAPYEITLDIEDDTRRVMAVALPRPDFDGALTQFLIGLLQTACSPVTEDMWWEWRQENRPKPERLKELLKKYEKAFFLIPAYSKQASLGDEKENRSRIFMQEDFGPSKKPKQHPSSYLLIDAATDNTAKTNTDLFVKRQSEDFVMCPHCAAAALYTLQTFAPSGGGGGEGKFTSLRGGGPLTTLVLGENLWDTVWLNVVTKGFKAVSVDEKTFPWLKLEGFITDKKPVKEVHSANMNPAHVFWGMPRRIQLLFSEHDSTERCSVCGKSTKIKCRKYLDCSGGLTYQQKKGGPKKPSWIEPLHPQTPYRVGNDDIPTAVHPRPGGIGYRYWLGLIQNISDGNTKRLPAQVIEQFHIFRHDDGMFWAFGYDMDKMSARCWYDSTMPIVNIPERKRSFFFEHISNMIGAARYVSGMILSATLKATMMEPEKRNETTGKIVWKWPKELRKTFKIKADASPEELDDRIERNPVAFTSGIRSEFWNSTEAAFFQHLYFLRENLMKEEDQRPILESWRSSLRKEALKIFDSYSQTGDFDATDPRPVALARQELSRSLAGKFLYDKLGLPSPT